MKALAVIPKPKTCKTCMLVDVNEHSTYCRLTNKDVDESTKPIWCPLINAILKPKKDKFWETRPRLK